MGPHVLLGRWVWKDTHLTPGYPSGSGGGGQESPSFAFLEGRCTCMVFASLEVNENHNCESAGPFGARLRPPLHFKLLSCSTVLHTWSTARSCPVHSSVGQDARSDQGEVGQAGRAGDPGLNTVWPGWGQGPHSLQP